MPSVANSDSYLVEHRESSYLAELIAQVKSQPDDKANDALSEILRSKTTRKIFTDEISKLTKHVLSIDTYFRNGSAKLGELLQNSSAVHEQMAEARVQWDQKRQKYIELMWASRNLAVKGRSVADDFAGDFIGMLRDPHTPLATKKEEIAQYKHKLLVDREKAKEVTQDFTTIQKWVVDFKSNVFPLGDGMKINDNREREIEKLDKSISQLEGVLNAMDQKLSQVLLAFRVDSELGMGGAGLLAFLCPQAWVKATVAASSELEDSPAFEGYSKDYASMVSEIDQKRATRAGLWHENSSVVTIHEALKTMGDSQIAIVFSRVSAFRYTWDMIIQDLERIEAEMETTGGVESDSLFDKRLGAVALMYRSLSYALYQYATTLAGDLPLKEATEA